MQQHPIPQNVTAYQFRLIGDMTLKQFLELVAGVGTAILFYNTNLLFPIKFFLIIFFVFFGFALAFMPFEDRPLDIWLLAFIKSIYNPTNYVWKKIPQTPAFFDYKPHLTQSPSDSQEIMQSIIQRKRAGLSSYLHTLPPDHPLTVLEKKEKGQLSSISGLFNDPQLLTFHSQAPSIPTTSLNIDNIPPTPVRPTIQTPTSVKTISKTTPQTPRGVIPQKKIALEKSVKKDFKSASKSLSPQSSLPQPLSVTKAKITKQPPTVTAQTSSKLPFPSTPTTPNTVVGMVFTTDGKIIENAIIEVRDASQAPVRATKTNKLGQFFSTTPLKNGTYEIEVEKENFTFDILNIKLEGKVIDPIKIQAQQIIQ